jgi:hypothetical protein
MAGTYRASQFDGGYDDSDDHEDDDRDLGVEQKAPHRAPG